MDTSNNEQINYIIGLLLTVISLLLSYVLQELRGKVRHKKTKEELHQRMNEFTDKKEKENPDA